MSVQILQNLTESLNYFRETWCIRTLILFNFTNIINIETTVWKIQKQKWGFCDFCHIKVSSVSNRKSNQEKWPAGTILEILNAPKLPYLL